MDDDFLAELRANLIRTDMAQLAAATLVDELHQQFGARMVHLDDILAVINAKLRDL